MYYTLQLVEAFEVMILAILSATLKCKWNLNSVQEASITMVTTTMIMLFNYYFCVCAQVVFLGLLIANPIWGVVADKFGRKKVYN